ncbi:MAG: glycosyltransferase family 2 protein [Chloroflexi bacterium]|nr:glycosyltransferase family 2 protein [Chloroflexota bacterium]
MQQADRSPTAAPTRAGVSAAPSISVVLPAYNEAGIVEQTVLDVDVVLRALTDDYEIIVVDDGSRDDTRVVLMELIEAAPEIPLRAVVHERNQGYGAALASGFDAATKELIFMTDADGQFDVVELGRFLPALDPSIDMVIGWREQRADPPMRLLNAFGWKLLVNGLFGYTARDVDCAFKLFRRRVWQGVTVHARGATFSAELLIKARRLGFQMRELPVRHLPRTVGSATGARPDVILRAFRELFQLWRHLDDELADDRAALAGRAPAARQRSAA